MAASCSECKPLRTYFTDDVRFIGGVFAYPLAGCGKPRCQPAWIGTTFAFSTASPPVVVDDVILVAKGPASGFPVDAGFFTFDRRGCGAAPCPPISLVQLGEWKFYNGGPLAVADHKIFMASTDNIDGTPTCTRSPCPETPAPGHLAGSRRQNISNDDSCNSRPPRAGY